MVLYYITHAQFFNHTHFLTFLLKCLYRGFISWKVKTHERQVKDHNTDTLHFKSGT